MTIITLPGRCDRGAAEALLPELLALDGAGTVEIDGRAVAQVGQAVLQVLVSARHGCRSVSILPSETLRDAAALSGLSAILFDEAHG